MRLGIREPLLRKQGGFETRPYKSPDALRCLPKEAPLDTCGLPLGSIAPAPTPYKAALNPKGDLASLT